MATFGPDELTFPVTSERVSSGIHGLDDMLGGGYFRASTVLITGAPGTAKTSLGGAFAAAACERGEGVLYASFDEPSGQIVRNMASIGIDLKRHVDSGALRMYSVRTEVRSAEEHLVVLQQLIREGRPRALVIDPISALRKSGGQVAAADTAIRLLDFAKSLGVTCVCTSLVGGRGTAEEATDLQISTIADTWLHVSYTLQGGERNRALSIVKSRGMSHSNQVRELRLSDSGMSLMDVYVEGGDVLMGTARYEKEQSTLRQERQAREAAEQRRRLLEEQKLSLAEQLAALERQLAEREEEIRLLDAEQDSRVTHRDAMRAEVRRLRGGTGQAGEHGAA